MTFSLAATTLARDIYVDNVAGDDRYRGAAPAASNVGGGPVRTIARALRLCRRGDRVVLADTGEPYRECITLHGMRHSGAADRPFVIIGNGAVLDGSTPVPTEAWEQYEGYIFRFRPARMAYQQLFLDNRPLVRVAVDNNQLELPKLEPFEWCLLNRHIYLNLTQPNPDVEEEVASIPPDVLERSAIEGWRYLPQQYDLTHAGHPVGITLYDIRNVVVSDVVVQGYQLDGINAHDKAFNVSLEGIVARGNGRSGVSVGGASRVRLFQSLLGNNGAAQLRTEGYSVAVLQQTELLANTAPAIVRDSGEITIDGLILKEEVLSSDVTVTIPPEVP